MTKYLISYDLNKHDKNYAGVIEAIKNASNGVWCKPLESVWLIQSSLSATQISDRIKLAADANDRWLVNEITNNRQGWLSPEIWDYINKNL